MDTIDRIGAALLLCQAMSRSSSSLSTSTMDNNPEYKTNKPHSGDVGYCLPEHPNKVLITEDIIRQIAVEKRRTGISVGKLLDISENTPQGLTESVVHNWLCMKVETAEKAHLEFVLKGWRSLPSIEFVEITAEIQAQLAFEKKRSGVTSKLLVQQAKDLPKGLSSKIINSWIAGRITDTKKDDLHFVLQSWKDLPDKTVNYIRNKKRSATPQRLKLTSDIIEELKAERKRTRIKTTKLLANFDTVPKGLTTAIIQSWFLQHKTHEQKDYIDFVLKAWKTLPDAEIKIIISKPIIEQLRREECRTQVSIDVLLKNEKSLPNGITVKEAHLWFEGDIKTVKKEVVDILLRLYASLPDKRPTKIGGAYIELSGKKGQKLRQKIDSTGISLKRLFYKRDDLPKDFSWRKLQSHLPRMKIMKKEIYHYILMVCEESLSKTDY